MDERTPRWTKRSKHARKLARTHKRMPTGMHARRHLIMIKLIDSGRELQYKKSLWRYAEKMIVFKKGKLYDQ